MLLDDFNESREQGQGQENLPQDGQSAESNQWLGALFAGMIGIHEQLDQKVMLQVIGERIMTVEEAVDILNRAQMANIALMKSVVERLNNAQNTITSLEKRLMVLEAA
jgi:ABC-type ATPase with predicted acetyltransferase domain